MPLSGQFPLRDIDWVTLPSFRAFWLTLLISPSQIGTVNQTFQVWVSFECFTKHSPDLFHM